MSFFSGHLQLNVKTLQFEDGRMIPAGKYGQSMDAEEKLELTPEEQEMATTVKVNCGDDDGDDGSDSGDGVCW